MGTCLYYLTAKSICEIGLLCRIRSKRTQKLCTTSVPFYFSTLTRCSVTIKRLIESGIFADCLTTSPWNIIIRQKLMKRVSKELPIKFVKFLL